MNQLLHRLLIQRPFHTVTVVLVVFAVVQAALLFTHGRPAASAPVPPPPRPSQPAQPATTALLTTLRKLGPVHPTPTPRTVTDERQLNGKTVEVKTAGTVEAVINLATLSGANISVRSSGVANVRLPAITLTENGRPQQEYRVFGNTEWADVTPQANSQYPGLGQFTQDELRQLTSGVNIQCAAAYWAQQFITEKAAAVGFPVVTVEIGSSC
jgi:hypothetical protein